jgi:two-component system, OmpR family, response regulator
MFTVLVVEDDRRMRGLFMTALEKSGYRALGAEDGVRALEVIESEYVDLVISDIMMPGMDGYELTRALRAERPNLPVLMVTARESFQDKQKGFLVGTDDYMVKPVDVNEMILRVGALLRRARIVSERKLTIGGTVLDYDALTISTGGEILPLPQKEFLLMYKLACYPGQIFTRRNLMDEIWGPDTESEERTVDVHINRVREHLKDNPDFSILTVRGLGYKAVRKNA